MLPKELHKDTIIDSIIELRFESELPRSVIFGVIYNQLKEDFPIVEEKPLATLPEKFRLQDPSMLYQALYSVKNDQFVVQIGTNMIAIACYPKYLGWEKYTQTCYEVLNKVYSLGVISKVIRIGIRYINKFDGDLKNLTNVSLNVSNIDSQINPASLIFHVADKGQKFGSLVQYRHEIYLNKLQTIIDIDTSTEQIESSDYSYICNKIEEAHDIEKNIFFKLLKPELLESLGPKY